MHDRILIFLVCLAVGIAACGSIDYDFDYDRDTDFSLLQTYDWNVVFGSPGGGGDASEQEKAAFIKRLVETVDRQLEEKGLSRTKGKPDFLIIYSASVSRKTTDRDEESPGGQPAGLDDVIKGVIALDFIDASTKKMLWHCVSRDTIPGHLTPGEADREMDRIVAGMLEKFPPPAD